MNSRTLISTAIAGLIVLALATGCDKPPQQEIENANTTLEAARAANAERFAAEELAAARDKLEAALAEIEAQNSRKLLKSYDKAKILLGEASQAAATARDKAKANTAKAKTEAGRLLSDAETSIGELKALLDPRKIKDKSAYKKLRQEVDSLEETVTAVRNEFESDFLEALDKIRTAGDRIAQVKDSLFVPIKKK